MERDLQIVEDKMRSKYPYALENQEKMCQGVSVGLVDKIYASCRTGRAATPLLCCTAVQDQLKNA